ncbi:MAG: glycosyltransferase family 2 protein, partial [Candidatus Binatus sp.]
MARVSVILPVYNGAATIERALRSVFDQTFTDYEIVITDDGSTDDTPSILAKYGDKIRIVRQANRGLPAARNA